jgi:Do/DeqQ family serine protease
MKFNQATLGTALLLACGAASFFSLAETPATTASKVTATDLRSKLKLDHTPLPVGGQMQMSYAPVVDKILPSVVRITPSVRMGSGQLGMGGHGRSLDDLPPGMKDQFRRFFGLPLEEDSGGEEDEPDNNPNRRRAPAPKGPLQKGTGSGVVVTSDGYIITNNHVIEDAEKIEVTIGNSSKNYTAKLVGADPRTDVALIKIDATNLPTAVIGDSSKLRVGDVVLAAGSPMELSQSITLGIVSAMGRTTVGLPTASRLSGIQDFIQTDASINPGNSGGPLLDATGRVIGINTAILSRSGMNAGIGFSIPINLALSIVEDLVDDGKVTRGYLGVQMGPVSEGLGKVIGLDSDSGALIAKVTPGSPAEKAGLEPGDVIIGAASQKVEDSMGLTSIVGTSKPGTQLPLEVFREGKRITLTATLEAISDEELLAGGKRPGSSSGAGGGNQEQVRKATPTELIEGVTVQDLSAGLRQRYDVDEKVTGIVVLEVKPNSAAGGAGLEEGDIITSINTTKVNSLADTKGIEKLGKEPIFLRIIRAGKKDTVIIPGSDE